MTFREILDEAEKAGIEVQEVDRKRIKAIARTDEHQGVIALASPLSDETLASIMARAHVLQEDPFIVLVDGVTDPQNLGAILRTRAPRPKVVPEGAATPSCGKVCAKV